MPPLRVTTLSSAAVGPSVLILGGVHGDEYEPMAAGRRLGAELAGNLVRGQVRIVPVANEAAFARGQRTGPDEMDLARVCPGRDDGSPTEQIAAQLARLIREANYLIDLHSAGSRYSILPLAGYVLHPDQAVLDQQRQMAAAFGMPVVWGTNARMHGTTLAVARDAGVPAIYVENGGGGTCLPDRVGENVAGCRRVLTALGLLADAASEPAPTFTVEDDREGSGRLQTQHPAPADGFFQPAVALGEVVAARQEIGRVVDVLGEESWPIVAEQVGRVLFLRLTPSVRRGDCLLAILPVTRPGRTTFPRE